MPLLDRDDSVLVAIGLQPRFWGACYDWARTLADAVAFEAANPGLAMPPGFSL
jgi:hypothetical protein